MAHNRPLCDAEVLASALQAASKLLLGKAIASQRGIAHATLPSGALKRAAAVPGIAAGPEFAPPRRAGGCPSHKCKTQKKRHRRAETNLEQWSASTSTRPSTALGHRRKIRARRRGATYYRWRARTAR